MLIKIASPMSGYEWFDTTPGEECHFNQKYRFMSRRFCEKNHIDSFDRFLKVRIVREKGRYSIPDAWWRESPWQDQVFWCYQTPVPLYHKANQITPYLCYALEAFECKRVRQYELDRWGNSKFAIGDSLIVPCDCCDQCWDETRGGISDHKRERHNIDDVKDPDLQDEHLTTKQKMANLKTNEDKEEEVILEKRAAIIGEQIHDVTNDPKWNKSIGDEL